MSDRAKLMLGIIILVLALSAAWYSYSRSVSNVPRFVEVVKPPSPEVIQTLSSLRTEVTPTLKTVESVLDDFEARVLTKVQRDAPRAPKPKDFANLARELLETMLAGDYDKRNRSLLARGMRAASADQAGKADFESGVKQTTYLTSIGLEQLVITVVAEGGRRLVPDEVEASGFSRLTVEPSKGVFPDRDRVEASGPLVVELQVPMQLYSAPQMERKIIVPVKMRLAWDSEKQKWTFWSYVILTRPGEDVVGPPF